MPRSLLRGCLLREFEPPPRWVVAAINPLVCHGAERSDVAFADPSRASAALLTLPPGNYTAVVRGKNGANGVALVEAYRIE